MVPRSEKPGVEDPGQSNPDRSPSFDPVDEHSDVHHRPTKRKPSHSTLRGLSKPAPRRSIPLLFRAADPAVLCHQTNIGMFVHEGPIHLWMNIPMFIIVPRSRNPPSCTLGLSKPDPPFFPLLSPRADLPVPATRRTSECSSTKSVIPVDEHSDVHHGATKRKAWSCRPGSVEAGPRRSFDRSGESRPCLFLPPDEHRNDRPRRP